MPSFMSLLAGNAEDWKENSEQIVPEGTYVMRVVSFTAKEEDDVLLGFFRAEKPLGGGSEFAPARYALITARFGTRNEWQFLALVKALNLSLNNVRANLPTAIGKLFKARIIHVANERNPERPFINIRDIGAYDPNPTPASYEPDDQESLD